MKELEELSIFADDPKYDEDNPNEGYFSWYDLEDFITTSPGPWNHGLPEEFKEWDGYASDSFFSGVLLKYARDDDRMDFDQVVMATYYA